MKNEDEFEFRLLISESISERIFKSRIKIKVKIYKKERSAVNEFSRIPNIFSVTKDSVEQL